MLAVESYTVSIESTFLNMCAVPSKVIFCNISMCGVPGSCLIHLSLVFLIIPKFPITTGMILSSCSTFDLSLFQGLCTWTTFQLLLEPYFVQMELRCLLCNRSLIDDLLLLYLVYWLLVLCRSRWAYPKVL